MTATQKTLEKIRRVAAPTLAMLSFFGAAPSVESAERPAPVVRKEGRAELELAKLLSKEDVQRIAAGYARVAAELRSDLATLEPLRARERNGERIDWGKLANDYNGKEGGALNRVVAFQLEYDGTNALQVLAGLTGDKSWRDLAVKIGETFAHCYAVPASGMVPAYRNHSNGLRRLVEAGAATDEVRRAVLDQGTNAPYLALNPVTSEELKSPYLSRENALAMRAMVNARAVSGGKLFDRDLFDVHAKRLHEHLALWQSALENPGKEVPGWPKTLKPDNHGMSPAEAEQAQQTVVRCFMVAISAEAAVTAFEIDPRYRATLEQAGKTLRQMQTLWNKEQQAFPYTDRDLGAEHFLTKRSDGLRAQLVRDLNAMIGSAYDRVGEALGDEKLTEFGREVLRAGVEQMYTGGKQLNQALVFWRD